MIKKIIIFTIASLLLLNVFLFIVLVSKKKYYQPILSNNLYKQKNYPFYYKSNNHLLMNNIYGKNYFVGLFKSLEPISSSADQKITLIDPYSKNEFNFRIVKDIENPNLKVKAITLVGEENISSVKRAQHRDDTLTQIGTANMDIAIDFIDSIPIGSTIAVNFYPCDLLSQKQCNYDDKKNIYIIGLYKRIK